MEGGGPVLVPFAIGLAFFVMAGAVTDIVERTGLLKVPLSTAFARAQRACRARPGARRFAHFGLGVTLLGIVGETQWGIERIAELKPGQTISIRRYELHFDGMATAPGPELSRARRPLHRAAASARCRRDGAVQAHLPVARHRHDRVRADDARGSRQLYLSLGDPEPDGSIAVRLYYKPLVLLIWLGAVVMVIGGVLSLSDRRLRVGAPKPARSKAGARSRRSRAACDGRGSSSCW